MYGISELSILSSYNDDKVWERVSEVTQMAPDGYRDGTE